MRASYQAATTTAGRRSLLALFLMSMQKPTVLLIDFLYLNPIVELLPCASGQRSRSLLQNNHLK